MKIFISILFSYSLWATTNQGSISQCTNKNYSELLSSLAFVYKADDYYKQNILGIISLQSLDLIKSQVKDDPTHPDNFYWLLTFRPLPKHVEISGSFYPQVLLTCVKNAPTIICDTVSGKGYLIDRFTLNVSHSTSTQCPSKYIIKGDYSIVINDLQFSAMKKESTKLLTGSSSDAILKVVDKIFDPQSFFDSYFDEFYKNWLEN